MATVNTGWLVNENQDKFAPKTLMSQVIDNNGTSLEYLINNTTAKNNYYECHTSQSDAKKYISGLRQELVEGTEILIKFLYGHASSNNMYLAIGDFNNLIPVKYKGVSSYIILKETRGHDNCLMPPTQNNLIGDK